MPSQRREGDLNHCKYGGNVRAVAQSVTGMVFTQRDIIEITCVPVEQALLLVDRSVQSYELLCSLIPYPHTVNDSLSQTSEVIKKIATKRKQVNTEDIYRRNCLSYAVYNKYGKDIHILFCECVCRVQRKQGLHTHFWIPLQTNTLQILSNIAHVACTHMIQNSQRSSYTDFSCDSVVVNVLSWLTICYHDGYLSNTLNTGKLMERSVLW